MSKILDNMYILVFLVNSEDVLFLAFVKFTFFLLYFLEAKNSSFVTKNSSKSSYIRVFILCKKQHN